MTNQERFLRELIELMDVGFSRLEAERMLEDEPEFQHLFAKGKTMKTTLTIKGATAKFKRLVARRVARGMGHSEAVKDTARCNPKLHALMLCESSPRASRDTKRGILARAGLKFAK